MNVIQPDPFRFSSHSSLSDPLPTISSQSPTPCCHQVPPQGVLASQSSPVELIVSMLHSLIQMVGSLSHKPQPLGAAQLAEVPQYRTATPLHTSDPVTPSASPASESVKSSGGSEVWSGVKDFAASVLGAVGGGYLAKGAGALLGTFGKTIGGFLKKIF
jgi:hypothetical protein